MNSAIGYIYLTLKFASKKVLDLLSNGCLSRNKTNITHLQIVLSAIGQPIHLWIVLLEATKLTFVLTVWSEEELLQAKTNLVIVLTVLGIT